MDKRTIAINTPYERPDAYGALSVPIYNNVAFEFADAAEMADAFCNRINAPDYSRVENPTVTNLELRVRSLTNANSVAAFNSGMAAISNTLLATLKQGSEIVTSNHLFGNTLTLVSTTLARFGVKARLTDLTDLHEVEQALNDKTACVFLEAVTNPQLEIAHLLLVYSNLHTNPHKIDLAKRSDRQRINQMRAFVYDIVHQHRGKQPNILTYAFIHIMYPPAA